MISNLQFIKKHVEGEKSPSDKQEQLSKISYSLPKLLTFFSGKVAITQQKPIPQ